MPGCCPLRHTGGDHCVTRILRGKARAANDQDVVNPEPGLAACCHVRGRSIPYCGGIVEVNRQRVPSCKVRSLACIENSEILLFAVFRSLHSSIAQRETPDETKPICDPRRSIKKRSDLRFRLSMLHGTYFQNFSVKKCAIVRSARHRR